MIKIAFDVMGSDNGPLVAVQAALEFLKEHDDLHIVFYGKQDEIVRAIKESKTNINEKQYSIKHSEEVIDMHGSAMDVRRKKDASIVKALEAVKNKEVDGMLTGGSSAAFIAGSTLIVKNIEGISRAGFMPTIPTLKEGKVVLLLDAGANIDNTPEELLNFAKMSTAYSKAILNVKEPLVGLMNIGEEETKGKPLQRDTYQLMQDSDQINFYGNFEPRYIASGDVDIIIADGYTGNIALKSVEGMAKALMLEIKSQVTKTFFRKLAALCLKPAFKDVAKKFDYKNHAGAILLGVDGIVFKSHGSSDIRSFKATLRMTYDAVKNDVLNKVKKGLEEL